MGDIIQKCFISATAGSDVSRIKHAVIERGIQIVGLSEEISTESRPTIVDMIQSSIQEADLVVAVLTNRDNRMAMFELGLATALRKNILIFATPKADIAHDLRGLQIVRTNLQNREAITFALDQMIASKSVEQKPIDRTQNFGSSWSKMPSKAAAQINLLPGHGRVSDIATLIAQIEQSGAELVVQSEQPKNSFDLVVWSDELDPYIGNPFPIEVKTRLATRDAVKKALNKFATTARARGSDWGLLLYADGPTATDRVWLSRPTIFTMKIDAFSTRLKKESFASLIRSLRNQRVHGVNI